MDITIIIIISRKITGNGPLMVINGQYLLDPAVTLTKAL